MVFRSRQSQTFWVQISSGGVGVFHIKGWGPKSSECPSKPREDTLFAGISRDFGGISRVCPKSLKQKRSQCSTWPLQHLQSQRDAGQKNAKGLVFFFVRGRACTAHSSLKSGLARGCFRQRWLNHILLVRSLCSQDGQPTTCNPNAGLGVQR